MRTAHFPSSGEGGLPTPPDADPPPPGHVTCDACREANTPSPVDRMTDACENITLPQTCWR